MLLAGVRAESIFCALNFLGRGVDLWDGDVLGSGQSAKPPWWFGSCAHPVLWHKFSPLQPHTCSVFSRKTFLRSKRNFQEAERGWAVPHWSHQSPSRSPPVSSSSSEPALGPQLCFQMIKISFFQLQWKQRLQRAARPAKCAEVDSGSFSLAGILCLSWNLLYENESWGHWKLQCVSLGRGFGNLQFSGRIYKSYNKPKESSLKTCWFFFFFYWSH